MNNYVKRVREFHEKFNHPVSDSPRKLDRDRVIKRFNWMLEELLEFKNASTLEDQVDALIDLLYFIYGTFVEMGVYNIEKYFTIVHEANMSKLWSDGKPRYREDGKILKPPSWKDPKELIKASLTKEVNYPSLTEGVE